jgi:hypothetical protein
MHRADAFTPFNLTTSARTGSARACARDRQNRHNPYEVPSTYLINKNPNHNSLYFNYPYNLRRNWTSQKSISVFEPEQSLL